jgi:hypothetical protein
MNFSFPSSVWDIQGSASIVTQAKKTASQPKNEETVIYYIFLVEGGNNPHSK